MIILPEDKKLVSLLSSQDAKQLLLALFSEEGDLPEMSPLSQMAFTAVKNRSDKISKIRSKAGKTGGAPKGNQNAVKLAKQTKTNTKTSEQAKQPSNTFVTTSTVEHQESCAGLQEQRFAEFWTAYPRKIGKEAARKAWRHINPTADHHTKILAAINTAINCEQWQRDNGRYIPNPATWLNQGRWDDEVQLSVTTNLSKKNSSITGNFIQREYDDKIYDQFISSEFGKKIK